MFKNFVGGWAAIGLFAALLGSSACRNAPHDESRAEVPAQTQRYSCPMHPQVVSDKPGVCGLCGMALVPVPQTAGSSVHLSADRQRLIGLTTAVVEERSLHSTVRAPGRVVRDPTLLFALLEYQNLSSAGRGGSAGQNTPGYPDPVHQDFESRLRSAKIRLQQLGIDERTVQKIPLSAPRSNRPADDLWIYAEIYDTEIPLIKTGLPVQVEAPAITQELKGTVIGMDSALDKNTQTLRVLIKPDNAQAPLTPEMFVNATIQAPLGRRLCIPDSALMDTGTRQLVFVKKSEGVFEPRQIKVGRRADGYIEVLKGLESGEQVVTSANFFLDSESKLQTSSQ
jgi:hypothetical protein